MPPQDKNTTTDASDKSSQGGADHAAADLSRSSQQRPPDLVGKQNFHAEQRKQGRTFSSAGLPTVRLDGATGNKDSAGDKRGDSAIGTPPPGQKAVNPDDVAVWYLNTREDSRDPDKDMREGLKNLSSEQIAQVADVLRNKWGVDLYKDLPGLGKERLEKNIEDRCKSDAVKQIFKDKINEFEQRTPPVGEAEKAKCYEELNRLMEAKDPPPRADLPKEADRIRLARQVLEHAAHPDGIFQGDHGTCGAAALESKLYTQDPAAAAHMVREVATTGKFTPLQPPDAKPVEIHPSLVKPDEESQISLTGTQLDGARNYASEIFQGAAMSLVTPGYRQERPRPGDATDTGERSKEGDNPGLEPDEVREIERQVTGNDKPLKVLRFTEGDQPSPEDLSTHVSNQEELKVRLQELQRNGQMPVVVFVNTGEEPFLSDSKGLHAGAVGGGHFVTITHYDKDTGQVSFDNSWRQESDHLGNNSVPADKMFRAMRATVHQ